MVNKELLRKKHQLVVGATLPKKARGETETEELMKKIRWDKGDLADKFLTQKKKRGELINKRKASSSRNQSMISAKMEEDEDVIRMDDEDYEAKIKDLEMKKKDEKQKKLVVERMKRKISKKLNQSAQINEADKRIPTKMPRHLNSGHRGIGKTDRR